MVTTSSLADGQVGVAYSETLAATGGVTPYSWAVVAGSLPAGLSLNSSTGEISGTPTTSETANFTVEVTDSNTPADTDQQALSIYIAPETLTITTSSLPDGQVGVAYSETLQASGGVTPYSWAVVVGSLPAGLSLNSSTGEISGTPTAYGTSNFTVEVTDSDAPPSTDQQALSITVDPAPLVITTSSLADGQVGVAYSETLAATGGVTPYSWAVVAGSLPAGLSLNSSTGEISGTPTTGGTSNFTVEVTDSDAPASSDQQALSIYIPDDLVVTTSSLADGQIDVAYSQTLAATGGVTPYSWSIVAGALPAGLSLNSGTGEISGTPTTGGTSNFTVRATDSNTPADSDDQALSIYIPDDLLITTSSLADGQVGVAYSETLAATGGVTPYSWSIVSGSLPAGLSLNSSTGEISGTPTTSETANFTVEVTDSNTPADTDQQALSIYIAPETLTITTSSLPDSQVGVAYSETLQASGGVTPYSWAVVVGSLPAGLSLNSSTGEISGTPTAYGTSNFTVEVTDSDAPPSTDQQALSITVDPAPLVITTSSLADGQVGVAYSETLAATGGVTPYSWAIVSGSLPAGLSLSSSTGEISGTPTTGGTSNFTVEVTDSDAPPSSDQQALSIYIPDDLVVTTSSLADGQIDVAYSQTLAATGGVTPYSWSIVAGSLPAGLSLNSSTGEISGTPTTGGTSNFTVRVTDSQAPADTDDQALSIYIPDDLVVTTSSLADGQVGVGYSETLAATGGVTPYSWAVVVGSLPAGLSLNSSTGEISGTPTTQEVANFTVEVTDSNTPADTDQQALSITINPAGGPQTYYVATDGNDGWPGTQAQPWATLQYAVDTILPGDTIIVEDGTYVGCRIRSSGTAGNAKTLKAENVGGAVITSAGALCTTPSNLEVQADTPTNGVEYWVIDGFESTSAANYGFEIDYATNLTIK
ncbi:MAG: beta strand repeat-containing protein, partial [Planctomycetota bacterium]